MHKIDPFKPIFSGLIQHMVWLTRGLEIHLHVLALFRAFHFKIIPVFEPEHIADNVRREDLQLDIEIPDIGIVEAAGSLDLILSIRQLALQLQEILVGLEVRIIL